MFALCSEQQVLTNSYLPSFILFLVYIPVVYSTVSFISLVRIRSFRYLICFVSGLFLRHVAQGSVFRVRLY